jgi:hypothetical protein
MPRTTFNLTDDDISCLHVLSDEGNMTNTAYIRYMLQMMWAARNSESIMKTGKIVFEGKTYEIEVSEIARIGQQVAQILADIDWEGIIKDSNEKPKKRVRKPLKSLLTHNY